MNRLYILIAAAAVQSAVARQADPCHTKSHHMTLVKNCYTGDMGKNEDTSVFFTSTPAATGAASYCYNALVSTDHHGNEPAVRLRVLKESHDGQFHAIDYALTAEEFKKKKAPVAFLLKGLKGLCFSPEGNRTVCDGGLLKAIGFKDMDVPMVVAINKANNGSYAVSRVVYDRKEIETLHPREVEGVFADTSKAVDKMLQEIHRKVSDRTKSKMVSMKAGVAPKKLAEGSEQFRYCSLAMDTFVKHEKVTDPFTPDEKSRLTALTNYMNNDPKMGREPASN